ncbi:bifunctional diaminohydroxyphosphoribosylaminopyrimidine deaminase/5-amino-6-(5-phosphoribosylamino)uracil reductase RibD [Derxia lacustris]|uniref:bifunctional diaminohydroxyphosphoribosylaminopyrimidine deaminase/5-amino-6-(5-phosphoribosylamino)uracil reductase RibD n=1 Tax=Derxia lacustris TaxID=764842 RepID=UPI000A170A71|nr:bifunctional diaminohydroxyphosphoribosylaminopyrimidine deaminase/5-amino-6-(5-phosphoribosylamino)uracil reductase RibD [Derxia lacustris]
MFTEFDHAHMRRALAAARQGLFTTTPNPRVGCVIARGDEVLGVGFHRRAGEPHAEVMALMDARAKVGPDGIVGATAYVTLEPCNHFGRTPPCTGALREAKIARVVAAMEDPNPQVAGRGLQTLRDFGIDVRCGLLRSEAEALNRGFISRMTRGRPWVRMKIAASLDGRTALENGVSQWITGEAARTDGHAWRARACAVLTGLGTVRADDPQLNVRLVETPRQPRRVLIDAHLGVPLEAKIVATGTLVFAAGLHDPTVALKADALARRDVEVVSLPDASNKVDLPAMLTELGKRGINELHVEAGEKLNGSLLREGCVDELLIYLAPCLLGPGRGMAALPELTELDGRLALDTHSVELLADGDVRLLAYVRPR